MATRKTANDPTAAKEPAEWVTGGEPMTGPQASYLGTLGREAGVDVPADPTDEKVALALVPIAVMAAMHTTMISASMTAYSTAVGPSSFFRNSTACLTSCIFRLLGLVWATVWCGRPRGRPRRTPLPRSP